MRGNRMERNFQEVRLDLGCKENAEAQKGNCGSLNNDPQINQVSVIGTYECFLIWQTNFADVVKLRILQQYPELFE
jgi:hypothetical protein